MRTKSIMIQLFRLIVLSAVSLIILSVFAAVSLKNEMLDAAIDKTTNLAEVARATAMTFHQLAMKGQFDEAMAQSLAKSAIRGMRYGEDEYFFVYDGQGNELVHGTKPEREGKNFIDEEDAKGYAYIPDMLKLAKSGGGHIFYWFPKPGSDIPLRKVSSVVGVEPWGWMISTGVYLDDIDAHFWNALREFALIGGFSIIIVSVIAFLISQSIAKPVRALARVTARIGSGQYDVDVPATERADEIGILAGAILVLRDEAKAAERLRTEQDRFNRVLRTIGAGNAVLFHSVEEDELVNRMCKEIVETGGYRMAWIGLAEHDEAKTIRPVAVAGHEDGYLSLARMTWADEPRGRGPTGIAIRTGVPQVNDSTAIDATMSFWRTTALERQYRSSISLPMKGALGVLGCLTIYAAEPGAFSAVETVSLLVDLANNLAFGIRATRERRRREEMERQLNQAQKMEALGQLAGSVAHDFNNLLGAILGFAGFIIEDTAEDDPTRHHAERIVAAGQRGKTLIGQILSFARRGDLRRECFSMTELVDETRALLAATIPSTTQVTVIDGDVPMLVMGDRDQLQQVLINLCINAHDALGGQPGQVRIAIRPTDSKGEAISRLVRRRLECEGAADDVWVDNDGTAHAAVGTFDPTWPHVSLIVSDSGCGMDALVLQHVFTPFFTTKNKGYGTGLGLSMVHGAVLAHGGAVVVDSRQGSGTAFEVALPIADDTVRPLVDGLPIADSVLPQAGCRLLLVDDDPDFGDMLLTALERRGFEVSPFSDPREALTSLGERRDVWDAVVADQIMPHMTGLDFIRRVRAEYPDLPCILCTGYAEDNLDDESLKEAGIFALLRKPVDIDELMEILSRAVTGITPGRVRLPADEWRASESD
jgi:signal transduction histidine kinase/ActR/RegA family two-component response regulator/HAMP domain-containing protein